MDLDRDTFSEVFMIPSSTVSDGFTFSSDWYGFELKHNGQVVATLKRSGVWSSDFIATTPYGDWVIHRSGFWGNKGEIRDAASQQQLAVFKSGWGGKCALQFSDGQIFFVVTRGCWHPTWRVTTQTGQPVVSIDTRERSAELYEDSVVPPNRLSLLILFTLCRVQQAEEAEVVASAAAS